MLSHHELATLMLLRDTEKRLEPLDPDVLALRRYALVEVRQRQPHETTLQLTRQGRELLARLQVGVKD